MRKVARRDALIMFGLGILILSASTPLALAQQATIARYAKESSEVNRSAHVHSARHWKRRPKGTRISRRRVMPPGQAGVYYRSLPRLSSSYEADLLLDCLMSQPFVICP
jgi:hypothetical protein